MFKILLNKFIASIGPFLKFQIPELTANKSHSDFTIFLQFSEFIPPIAAHGRLNFFLNHFIFLTVALYSVFFVLVLKKEPNDI